MRPSGDDDSDDLDTDDTSNQEDDDDDDDDEDEGIRKPFVSIEENCSTPNFFFNKQMKKNKHIFEIFNKVVTAHLFKSFHPRYQ